MSRKFRSTNDASDGGASWESDESDEPDVSAPSPIRSRAPRVPLPPHDDRGDSGPGVEFCHDDLIAALAAVEGLMDVGGDRPNFHFRSRAFLHFHESAEGAYADVRFGSGDFEPVWASTPLERQALLARVREHVEEINRGRKTDQARPRRERGRRG